MTIRFKASKLKLFLFFWGCLIWSGCSAIIPQSNYIWSENYALDTNGGHCSSPEMNDGNPKTFGKLGLHAVGQMDSAILQNSKGAQFSLSKKAGSAHWRKTPGTMKVTQVKVQPQAKVQFRQKQSIDKIVIHATNLYGFEIYWQDDTESWQLLTSMRQSRKTLKSPIVIRVHTVTDAILLQAKFQRPTHVRKLMEVTPQFEIELDEARIAEIEVYGKQMKEQSE